MKNFCDITFTKSDAKMSYSSSDFVFFDFLNNFAICKILDQ